MENFNLEDAECELETIASLLRIYREFCSEECPGLDNANKTNVYMFASRMHDFISVIDAIQDKIIKLTDNVSAAIKSCYAGRKPTVLKELF